MPKSKSATWNVCKASGRRGDSVAASYNTTRLIQHLQRLHVKGYQEFMLANTQEDTTRQRL